MALGRSCATGEINKISWIQFINFLNAPFCCNCILYEAVFGAIKVYRYLLFMISESWDKSGNIHWEAVAVPSAVIKPCEGWKTGQALWFLSKINTSCCKNLFVPRITPVITFINSINCIKFINSDSFMSPGLQHVNKEITKLHPGLLGVIGGINVPLLNC